MQSNMRRVLFTGSLAVALLVLVGTTAVQAKSHKRLAGIATSPCSDTTALSGKISKEEKRRQKHKCLDEQLLNQDLSGASGLYLTGG